eukprot:TRINITY_DN33467_c0_g1_i1.p1 TRINITY_DN33467_c0_g1~~TRINITY_DN33467_c0_g1_i1.p1  ORF type:complete len:329 (-),score=85.05 TRINITY_DN33467_c0_g1_i1:38-1024(-)
MTEWWVSQKKHFCEYCKVWTGGHLWQIRKHEEGRMHNEKKELYLKNSRQRLKDKEREEEDVKRQLEEIEKAAHAAMGSTPPVPPPVAASKEREDRAVSSTLVPPSLEVAKEKEAIQQTTDKAKRKRKEPGVGCDDGGAAGATAGPVWPGAPAPSAPAAAATAPVPAAEGSPWLVCTDPNSGHVYYYNKSTGVSSWERPADLGVDLSKPPPPPSMKPPPPPAKKKKGPDAAPGMWEEVKPEESMWHHPDEFRRAIALPADDSDEENAVNPLGELKQEMKGRKGEWAQEDLEKRDIEMVEKRSNNLGNATFGGGGRKKAGGIRKKREDDD